jgi:Domain of unknown function (DUF4149)
VIGFLRLIGLLNSALWLGTAVFFTFGISRVTSSGSMRSLLGATNYPYFSVAIAQVLVARYFWWQCGCSLVAVLHVAAEWLYFGKVPRRFWLGLLAGLVALNLLGALWLTPHLKEWHTMQYALNASPQRQEAAGRTFNAWQRVFQAFNLMTVAGVAIYFLRIANPPDPARFVSAVKFRT